MTKATVRICVPCPKCKDKAMTSLGNVKGVDKVELDDSTCPEIKVQGKFDINDLLKVTNCLKFLRLVSVEEEKKPEPKPEPKPAPKPEPKLCLPEPCQPCYTLPSYPPSCPPYGNNLVVFVNDFLSSGRGCHSQNHDHCNMYC